jgi:multidrug efflux system membrane fusion protein
MFAVKSGLAPGDRIVVDGADRLHEGAKVSITAAGESDGNTQSRPAASPQPDKGRPKSERGSGSADKP